MSYTQWTIIPMVEKASSIVTCTSYILITFGYVLFRTLYLLWLHPLSNIPGPKLAALTDLWKANAVRKRRFASVLRRQHQKYGDLVRIGPNEVSIVAPEEVQTIYGPASEYLKGPFYDTWNFDGKTHFSDRDPVTHAQGRKAIAGAYSISHLTTLEQYCDSCTELLFRHLDNAAENDVVTDISTLLEWYTLDAVSAIGFGQMFGLLEHGGDSTGVTRIIADVTQTLTIMSTLSNFNWIVPTRPVAWFTSVIMGDKGPSLLLDSAARHVIRRQALRERDPTAFEEEKDMLYRFMVSKDAITSQYLDTRALISNCFAIIVAGADTTRATMVPILECIYSNGHALGRLRNEIGDAIAKGLVSFPITYAQAARLEFLGACIKEAMRLYPAIGMPLQRVVPEGGRVIAGRFYAAGTLVGMTPREIHCDPRAYGKDATEWRPDRWLEGNRVDLEKPNLAWGGGTRVCLGKNISQMEMFKLIPTIVHKYDITITNPSIPYKVSESWFATPTEFFCTVTKREHV